MLLATWMMTLAGLAFLIKACFAESELAYAHNVWGNSWDRFSITGITIIMCLVFPLIGLLTEGSWQTFFFAMYGIYIVGLCIYQSTQTSPILGIMNGLFQVVCVTFAGILVILLFQFLIGILTKRE